jgi:putative peptidoglycan lipid II flippase
MIFRFTRPTLGQIKTLLSHSSWAFTLTAGLSYGMGLLRDRIFAHAFGLSRILDIYNASFVIPDMAFAVLLDAALAAAFIPIFVKLYDQEKEKAYTYARQMLSWGVIFMGVVAVVIGLILPWLAPSLVPGFNAKEIQQYIWLTRILLISPVLFTLSNTYGRMLISQKEFFWYGLSPALYNFGLVIGALWFAPHFGTTGLVIGDLLGILLHFGIRYVRVRSKEKQFKARPDLTLSPEIKETMKLTPPRMAQQALWNLMLLGFTSIASGLPQGSVTAYLYARNFQGVPVSLLGIAIALAMAPSLAHDAGKGNFAKFRQDFKRNRMRSLIYTTLAALGLAIVAKPAISILLGGGKFTGSQVDLLASVVAVYCISVPLESLMNAYQQAYYALKNTWIPSAIGLGAIGISILTAKALAPLWGLIAIPAGFSTGLGVEVALLTFVFPILLRKREKEFQPSI